MIICCLPDPIFATYILATCQDCCYLIEFGYLTGFLLSDNVFYYPLQSEQKWKQIAELAIQQCEFPLAQECLFKAQDYAALLLLASCSCDGNMMLKLATEAEKCGKYNVAYLAYFSLGR